MITDYHAPGGLGVRVDCALYHGYTVPSQLRQPGRQADRPRHDAQRMPDAAAPRAARNMSSAASTRPSRCISGWSRRPISSTATTTSTGSRASSARAAADTGDHSGDDRARRLSCCCAPMPPASSRWRNGRRSRACSGSIRSGAASCRSMASTSRAASRARCGSEPFEVRCDTAFEAVMRGCAEPTAERPKTWINDEIVRLYRRSTVRGFAHSVEMLARRRAGRRALRRGARRAPSSARACSAASPTPARSRWSHLVARLRLGGFRLLDTQFVTEHLQQFGAVEISRARISPPLDGGAAAQGLFPARAARRRDASCRSCSRARRRRRRDAPAPRAPGSTRTSSR